MEEGRDVCYDEALEAADADCEPEQLDAEHPLYVLYTSGSTAKPKGVQHTTGGYLLGVTCTHKYFFDLSHERTSSGARPTSAGSPATSYIVYGPLSNGTTSVMYEGAPDYPDKDVWWGIVERYGVTIFYTAPTAIRACIKWGADVPGQVRPLFAAPARDGRRADQPEGLALVLQGDRRRALPDRRHLVADRDRRILISPLPGVTETKPGSATKPLPGIYAAISTRRATRSPTATAGPARRSASPWPGMLRTLYQEDERFVETYYAKFGDETTYFVGDAARKDADGYFWLLGRVDDVINVSGHRLSTAEIESAMVSTPKVAECAVIGQRRRDHRPGDRAFVTLEGDLDGTTRSPARSASTWRSGSARSRGRSASSGRAICRRPVRARSCGACCATSPRAASSAT